MVRIYKNTSVLGAALCSRRKFTDGECNDSVRSEFGAIVKGSICVVLSNSHGRTFLVKSSFPGSVNETIKMIDLYFLRYVCIMCIFTRVNSERNLYNSSVKGLMPLFCACVVILLCEPMVSSLA